MKTVSKILTLSTVAVLLSTAAYAAENSSVKNVKNMSNGQKVQVVGTVDSVNNEREFTLIDKAGEKIDVDIESNQSIVLSKGNEVTVMGAVDKDVTGTDINASNVEVIKNPLKAAGEVLEGNTAVSFDGATNSDIKNLPKSGLVKVDGTVKSVSSEKKFTLQDETGSIDVDVDSSQNAAVTKGAHVTVVGYVDKGLLGSDINAKKVIVTSNARTAE